MALARRLAAAAKAEKADLILTGLQSDDLGLGQTGVVMAEMLGIPHATIVMQVEMSTLSVRVKRELEDGWFQWVRMPMPALLTIQSGISQLRYATLMGIKKAKTKEVRRITPDETPARETAHRHAASHLPAAPEEGDADPHRHARRGRGQAGGRPEIRGEGHMNGVLVILEYARRPWNRMSWEALAAGTGDRRADRAAADGRGGGQRAG